MASTGLITKTYQDMTKKIESSTPETPQQPLLVIHGVGRSVSKSKYWKDCPKCGLKMTYGQLVTEEGYCWSCNHRGVF